MRHRIHHLLLLVIGLFFSFLTPLLAAGNCSPYLGQASLNEFFKDQSNMSYDIDDFVEIKILNPSITSSIFDNWTIKICEENDAGNNNDADGCSGAIPVNRFVDKTPPWIVIDGTVDDGGSPATDYEIGKYVNFKTGFDAILLDHNNDVIDYVSVDGVTQLEESACTGSALAFPYQATAPGASDKFIYRTPDGTGPWGSAPSASTLPSEDDTNDVPSGGGSYPILTVTDVTVTKGTSAVFTLTLDKVPVTAPITINYETLGGTAIPSTSSPSDYTYANSSIDFNTGETSKTITINTNGINPASSGEVFFYLYMQSPTANVSIPNAYPKGTILGTVSQKIILSTGSQETLDGLTFTNGSLAQYDPNTSPATLYFGESKFAGGDENINAVSVLPSGNIILSTGNDATLGLNNLSFRDGDLVKYDPIADNATLYFDESNFSGNEDITAVYVPDDESYIILSTADNAILGSNNLSFRQGDIVKYHLTGTKVGEAEIFLKKDKFSSITGAIDGVHVLDSGNILISSTESATLGGYSFRDGDIVEYNSITNLASLYFNQDLFSRSGADINALTLPKAVISTIHHIEIVHDQTALTCNPEQVTIKACANADCSTLFSSTATVGLDPAGWVGGDSVTFTGSTTYNLKHTVAETATLSTTNVTPVASNSLVCKTAGGTVIDPCDIVFSDSGFIFRNDDDSVSATTSNTTIPVQISGKPSNKGYNAKNLSLRAVQKSATDPTQCAPAFQNKILDVDFAAECLNPSSCISTQLFNLTSEDVTGNLTATTNNNSDVGSSSYDTRTITFDADGKANIIFTYPEAGIIELHARHNILQADGTTPSGNYMTGSSTFVVRPFAFHTTVTGNPAATSASGAAFTSAGTNFTVNVQAVAWQETDDANDDGIADGHEVTDTDPSNNTALSDNTVTRNYGQESTTEQVILNSLLHLPSPGNDPGINDTSTNGRRITSFNVATGTGTTSSINYPEVGIIELSTSVNDADYLAIGAPETAKLLGKSGYVGRFYPHHFDTEVTQGCNTFTYSGQPFRVKAIAKNNLAVPDTTLNYTGIFAKDTTVSNAGVTTLFSNNTIQGGTGASGGQYINGEGQTSLVTSATPITYTFTNKDTIPDDIVLRAQDADTSTATGINEASVQIRSGRLRLENAFGSELTDLTMPINAEFYSDNTLIYDPSTPASIAATQADDGFILNTDDSCTTFDVTASSFTNYTGNLSASDTSLTSTGIISSGLGEITFSAPGTGNEGSVNLLLNSTSTSSWLTYNWNIDCDNADGDDDITTGIDAGLCGPYGTASFGLYRGDDRIIYQREVF